MSQRIGQFFVFLIGLIVLIAGVATAGALFVFAIRTGSTVGAAFIAAIATVAAALVLRGFERQKVMEEVRREQLTDTYVEMAQVLHGREASEKQRNEVMAEFMRKSLVYASAKTIKAFGSWAEQIPEDEAQDLGLWRASSLRYEAFVKAMRSDLGISNRSLREGDLIRIGVDDWK